MSDGFGLIIVSVDNDVVESWDASEGRRGRGRLGLGARLVVPFESGPPSARDVGKWDRGNGELGAKSNSFKRPVNDTVLFAVGLRNGDLAGTEGGMDEEAPPELLALLRVDATDVREY